MNSQVDLKVDQWAAADASKFHQTHGKSRMPGDTFNPFNRDMKSPPFCWKGSILKATGPAEGKLSYWVLVHFASGFI